VEKGIQQLIIWRKSETVKKGNVYDCILLTKSGYAHNMYWIISKYDFMYEEYFKLGFELEYYWKSWGKNEEIYDIGYPSV